VGEREITIVRTRKKIPLLKVRGRGNFQKVNGEERENERTFQNGTASEREREREREKEREKKPPPGPRECAKFKEREREREKTNRRTFFIIVERPISFLITRALFSFFF